MYSVVLVSGVEHSDSYIFTHFKDEGTEAGRGSPSRLKSQASPAPEGWEIEKMNWSRAECLGDRGEGSFCLLLPLLS